MARPLGDIDMVPLRAALAGHAHAVWVAMLAPAFAWHPLPSESPAPLPASQERTEIFEETLLLQLME